MVDLSTPFRAALTRPYSHVEDYNQNATDIELEPNEVRKRATAAVQNAKDMPNGQKTRIDYTDGIYTGEISDGVPHGLG